VFAVIDRKGKGSWGKEKERKKRREAMPRDTAGLYKYNTR